MNPRPASSGVAATAKYDGVTARRSTSIRAPGPPAASTNVLPSVAPLSGSCEIAAAPDTPGRAASASTTRSKNAADWAPMR